MKKVTLAALAGLIGVTTLGSYAVAQNANFQGQGQGFGAQTQFADASGQRGPGFARQGGNQGPRFCNPAFEERREARQEAVDAFVTTYLGLNAEQTALYAAANQAKAAADSQMDGVCEQISQGQRPDRATMEGLREPVKQAMDAFVASLSEEQKQAFSLIAPKPHGPQGGPQGGQQGAHNGGFLGGPGKGHGQGHGHGHGQGFGQRGSFNN